MLGGLRTASYAVLSLLLVVGDAYAQFPARPTFPRTAPPFAGARRGALDKTTPILFAADEVTYDDELGLVTAKGHVEFTQNDRILMATTVSFNQKTRIVTASGDVNLLEPTGEVTFADYAELTDDLRDGIIEQFRLLLTDRSRMAAVSAERIDGHRTVLRRAVYSPCEPCKEDPDRAPLWQVKASQIVHDTQTHEIEYRNASVELFGLPVFYAPYFSHPDPTVKRSSGFLAPSYIHDSTLGSTVIVPYYAVLDRDQDFTISPIFTQKYGAVAVGQYRQRFTDGYLELNGSYVNADRGEGLDIRKDRDRGHIKAEGRFDLDETYRARFRFYRASDDTYLRLFRFDSAPTLRSNGYLDGFLGPRSFLQVGAFASQEMRADVSKNATPKAVPVASYSTVSERGGIGDYWSFDANAVALFRGTGPESRRVISQAGWHLPLTSSGGHVWDLALSLRGDAYSVQDVPLDNGQETSGLEGRVLPQAVLGWRFPVVKTEKDYAFLVEPIAQTVLSPNNPNTRRIPNEDSGNVEFDDTNLFLPNRYPGYDRVEGGQRVTYGLRAGVYEPGGATTSVFVGQSYRLNRDESFAKGTGLEDHLSDMVGRVQVSPVRNVDLLYRFRFAHEGFDARRNEFSFRVGPAAFNVVGNYSFVDQDALNAAFLRTREQAVLRVGSQITERWSAYALHQHDIANGGGLLSQAGIRYADECLIAELIAARRSTSDREINSGDAVLFRVVFKQLGEVRTSAR